MYACTSFLYHYNSNVYKNGKLMKASKQFLLLMYENIPYVVFTFNFNFVLISSCEKFVDNLVNIRYR